MNVDTAKVCIIDYGSGNVRSVFNIFQGIHGAVKVSNRAEDIAEATHLVLPGVGAFKAAMEKILGLPSFRLIEDAVMKHKKLFLGICVGMQVLAEEGEEYGICKGLGWIPGRVVKVDAAGRLLPHVGWNNLSVVNPDPLLDGIGENLDFYYVHSYCFAARDRRSVIAQCSYGTDFPAIIGRDNIYGVQFHPEKSQNAGKVLLKNFLKRR